MAVMEGSLKCIVQYFVLIAIACAGSHDIITTKAVSYAYLSKNVNNSLRENITFEHLISITKRVSKII